MSRFKGAGVILALSWGVWLWGQEEGSVRPQAGLWQLSQIGGRIETVEVGGTGIAGKECEAWPPAAPLPPDHEETWIRVYESREGEGGLWEFSFAFEPVDPDQEEAAVYSNDTFILKQNLSSENAGAWMKALGDLVEQMRQGGEGGPGGNRPQEKGNWTPDGRFEGASVTSFLIPGDQRLGGGTQFLVSGRFTSPTTLEGQWSYSGEGSFGVLCFQKREGMGSFRARWVGE